MEALKFENLPQAVQAIDIKLDQILESVSKSSEQPEQRYNVAEVANYLDLSVPTIYRYVKDREIPCSKRAGRLIFFKSQIDQWLAEGKLKTVDELAQEVAAERG